jgi:sialate O-acetylesterase
VKPDALFSDQAVLQHGVDVPVWGKAKPGEEVTVEIAGQKVSTVTAENGKWMVKLKPLAEGGPHALVMRGENTVTANDVLVGEVWLCSGQSNMGRTLLPPEQVQPRRPYWEESVAKANYPQIRHFLTKGGAMDEVATESSGEWKICLPENAKDFTAVGYFFARDLTEARKVPVGLINSSVGATGGASWVSRETLESDPKLKSILDRQEKNKREYQAALEKYQAEEPQLLATYETAVKESEKNGTKAPAKPNPPRNPFTDAYRPTGYYNSKIAPLQPYAIKGVLWYQGENNRGQAAEYRVLLSALIIKWREAW